MIDALFLRYSKHKEKPLDPDYKPSQAIVSRQIFNKSANRLAVIFPGWHTHRFPVDILARRLAKRGWTVLLYDFHNQILEPKEDVVVESFRYIRDTICSELNKLLSEKHYQQVHMVSISMGGVPLAMVCDKFPHFTSVTAVLGGGNLAIDMWHGARTDYYRQAFEKMHISVRQLTEDWNDLAPEQHLGHFKGKQVKFVISLRDNFVMTKYQKKLAKDLLKAGADLKLKRRWSGHVVTASRYCLFDPVP